MGRAGITWMCGAFAPWCLGFGMVVSFTAVAGQDVPSGASLAPIASHAPSQPNDLVPATRTALAAFVLGRAGEPQAAFWLASLGAGAVPDGFAGAGPEAIPKIDFKRYVRLDPNGPVPLAPAFPEVERSRKSDPFVALRPAFDAGLRDGAAWARRRTSGLAFGIDEAGITSAFQVIEGDVPGPDAVAGFEPWPEGGTLTTRASRADISPGAGSSTRTGSPVAQVRDGATPAVPRAVALASATPIALDATPVEVIALARTGLPAPAVNATIVPRTERPDYAALLDPDHVAREKRCLAEAIYFEARSESESGQAAVAQVIFNRVNSGLYPSSVCGVVYQNRQRRNACQFSFACDGKSLKITEPEPWAVAVRIADAVTTGETYSAGVGASTHYHANYVRPRWAKRLKKMDVIGNHIFYKLRPGQT